MNYEDKEASMPNMLVVTVITGVAMILVALTGIYEFAFGLMAGRTKGFEFLKHNSEIVVRHVNPQRFWVSEALWLLISIMLASLGAWILVRAFWQRGDSTSRDDGGQDNGR